MAIAFLLTIETIVLSLLIRDSNFVSDTVQCSVCNAIVSSIKATIVSSIAASNDFLFFVVAVVVLLKKITIYRQNYHMQMYRYDSVFCN